MKKYEFKAKTTFCLALVLPWLDFCQFGKLSFVSVWSVTNNQAIMKYMQEKLECGITAQGLGKYVSFVVSWSVFSEWLPKNSPELEYWWTNWWIKTVRITSQHPVGPCSCTEGFSMICIMMPVTSEQEMNRLRTMTDGEGCYKICYLFIDWLLSCV